MIYKDECTVERGRYCWVLLDIEGYEAASIPFELAKDEEDAALILEQVADGYNAGVKAGERSGKWDLQRDLCNLLGAAQPPANP